MSSLPPPPPPPPGDLPAAPTGSVPGIPAGGTLWPKERLAPLRRRFVGLLVDLVPAVPVLLLGRHLRHTQGIGSFRSGSDRTVGTSLPLWQDVALLLPGFLYIVGCIGQWGRTLGQRVMGLRVVDRGTGGPPSWRQAVVRWVVASGPAVVVSLADPPRAVRSLVGLVVLAVFLPMVIDDEQRGLHDRFAGVIVLRDQVSAGN